MNPRTATEQLAQADRARSAAESPRLPVWTPALAGIAVTVGFLALALLPFDVVGRLAAVALALALWATAGWLVLRLRVARGVRGLHGRGRTTAVVLMACALSLVPGALAQQPAMRWPYLMLAVVGGVAMAVATRQRAERA